MRETKQTEKIWLIGPESRIRGQLLEQLRQIGAQTGREVADALRAEEVPAADGGSCLVLLLGDSGPDGETDRWKSFGEFSQTLLQLKKLRPRRSLLLSDPVVYGKLFGAQRPVKEEELGYVSHISAGDSRAQCLRMEEHLCCRLAREDGLDAGIVRADWDRILADCGHPGDMKRTLEILLRILEDGGAGEVYNLPAGVPEDTPEDRTQDGAQCAREHSPLSPIAVIPDTGKAEKYAASRSIE